MSGTGRGAQEVGDPARQRFQRQPHTGFLEMRQRFPNRRLRFFAARDLEVGEELTFDYGDDYWIGREDELRE